MEGQRHRDIIWGKNSPFASIFVLVNEKIETVNRNKYSVKVG